MVNLDIIIPFKNHYKGLPFFVNKWNPDWFPVFYNHDLLRKKGLEINFYNLTNIKFHKLSDVVAIDSGLKTNLYSIFEKSNKNLFIELIKRIKKYSKKLILFDTKDSTNLLYNLLPHVDLYLKKQLLKNDSLYEEYLVGNRLYTDYYSNKYKLKKDNFYNLEIKNSEHFNSKISKDRRLFRKYKKKITLSWNIAFSNYNLNTIKIYAEFFKYLKKRIKIYSPSRERYYDLSANFNLNYQSRLISFQRRKLLKKLSNIFDNNSRISLGYISSKHYYKILKTSKTVISPFGWGEICYRDFETFISGACLIKPKLTHLRTWPDLFKENFTYIPLSWEIKDWERLPDLLEKEDKLREIAENGQNLYRNIWSDNGRELFCQHFLKLINLLL